MKTKLSKVIQNYPRVFLEWFNPTALATLRTFPNCSYNFGNSSRGVRATAHERPQLEIDPSDDDVEEYQTIYRARDLAKIVLRGYAAQKIAKNRLVGEKTLTGLIGGRDLAIDSHISRRWTLPLASLWILINLNPSVNYT